MLFFFIYNSCLKNIFFVRENTHLNESHIYDIYKIIDDSKEESKFNMKENNRYTSVY